MKVVISQSMYFPWVGLLEQIKLADTYVYYDDVQYSKGSFTNRVQLKTKTGIKWLTVPTYNRQSHQNIDEVLIDNRRNWKNQHKETLKHVFANAPFLDDVIKLFDNVAEQRLITISDVSRASIMVLTDYFSLNKNTKFVDSKTLNIGGSSSKRVLDIVKAVDGDEYITGHGASKYLDHQLFEKSGVSVWYMDYGYDAYPQKHGDFTPYITALDLVANCGAEGVKHIHSNIKNWREFCEK